jgi:hypothetical protein
MTIKEPINSDAKNDGPDIFEDVNEDRPNPSLAFEFSNDNENNNATVVATTITPNNNRSYLPRKSERIWLYLSICALLGSIATLIATLWIEIPWKLPLSMLGGSISLCLIAYAPGETRTGARHSQYSHDHCGDGDNSGGGDCGGGDCVGA